MSAQQKKHPFDLKTQYGLGFSTQDDEIVVDFFCGGGAGTVTNTGSQQQLVTASLVHLCGNCDSRDAADPLHTISSSGTHHGLVTAFMERQFGASVGQAMDEPTPTITAGGGGKSSLVEFQLAPEVEADTLRVAAFLISYYGTENVSAAGEPARTITTKDRLGLVTVTIKGTPYVNVDIYLRMLQPAERYKAQGFPATTSSATAPTAALHQNPAGPHVRQQRQPAADGCTGQS